MAADTLSSPQLTAPAASVGLMVESLGAYAYGSWVTILDPLPADALLTGVSLQMQFEPGFLTGRRGHVQIGVGAAGAETPIATIPVECMGKLNQCAPYIFPVALDLLPNGGRIAARLASFTRWSAGFALSNGPYVSVLYVLKPITGSIALTTHPVRAYPTDADLVSVPAIAVATLAYESAWVEVIASAASALTIDGLFLSGQQTAMEVDVGVGALGAEVAVATVAMDGNSVQYAWGPLMLPHALAGKILMGNRVSLRMRLASATAGTPKIGWLVAHEAG